MIDMGNRNIIGKNIQIIRKSKNITQEELEARLQMKGISIDRPMISKIENSSREILDFEILGIAEALGVSIEDLFKNCYCMDFNFENKSY
jgi:transcriptional regulator with XRE-family HTH domain